MNPVTDPALLAQLNGGGMPPGGMTRVTDPALLAQLNTSPEASLGGAFMSGAYSPFKPIVDNSLEALKSAATGVGEAISEPLNGPTASGVMAVPDAVARTIGKVGNVIGGAGQAVFSPVTGGSTASVEPFVPAASQGVKSLVPTDPRFQPIEAGPQVHTVAQGIGNDLATTAGLGMAANQGAANQGAANMRKTAGLPPAEPPSNPLQPVLDKLAAMSAEQSPRAGFLASSSSDPMQPPTPPNPYGGFISNVRKGMSAPDSEGLTAAASALEQQGGQSANAMRRANTALTPEATQQLVQEVNARFSDPVNELFPGSHDTTIGQLQRLNDEAAKGPLRLAVINNIRSQLGGASGEDSAMAGVMRNTMLDSLGTLDKSAIHSGDPAGVQHFNEFLNGWKQKSRYEDVANIVKATDNSPNRADALQRKFTNFINNNENLKNFTPEEIEGMRRIAARSTPDGLQKTVGSFGIGPNNKLIPMLSGGFLAKALGPVNAIATTAVASGVRGARNAAVRGRAQTVLDMIANRDTSAKPMAEPPAASPSPPMLALPAPAMRLPAEQSGLYRALPAPSPTEPRFPSLNERNTTAFGQPTRGDIRPMTQGELESYIANQQAQAGPELGMTPDVRAAQQDMAASQMEDRLRRARINYANDPRAQSSVGQPDATLIGQMVMDFLNGSK